MKIVNISESISSLSGGLQSTVVGFANALGELGNNVLIVHGKDAGSIDQSKIRVNSVSLRKIGIWKLSRLEGLESILDYEKPDLIIQHGMWRPFVNQITAYSQSRKTPFAVVPHGMLDSYILMQQRFQKLAARVLFQDRNILASKLVRVLNENEKKHVIQAYPNVKTVVAPNGLDFPYFTDAIERNESAICFLGRIDHKKSVLLLIKAWRSSIDKKTLPVGAKLLIAGWASNVNYLDLCRASALGCDSIEFVGSVFDDVKWRFLRSVGGFILPSLGEGLPTAVLEAWAAGAIPIITPECNFPGACFDHSALRTGSSEEDISASLVRYYGLSDDRRIELRLNGAKDLLGYSWDASARDFMDALAV